MYTVIGYYRDADEVVVAHVKAKDPSEAARRFFEESETRKGACGIVSILTGRRTDRCSDLVVPTHGLIHYDQLTRKARK